MKHSYCTPGAAVVEHCEPKCTEHLSKYKPCPDTGLSSPSRRLGVWKARRGQSWWASKISHWLRNRVNTEFDRLPADATRSSKRERRFLAGLASPPLNEVYNLDEIGVIRKGIAPQPAREEPTIHDGVEQPGPCRYFTRLLDILGGEIHILDVCWTKKNAFSPFANCHRLPNPAEPF